MTIRSGSQPATPGRPTSRAHDAARRSASIALRARLEAAIVREQRLAVDHELAPRGVQRRHQQRRRRRRAHEPHRPRDRVGVDPAGRRDVQHRRCVSEPTILCVEVSTASAPCCSALGGSVAVEAEVRAPRLVDDERDARGVATSAQPATSAAIP